MHTASILCQHSISVMIKCFFKSLVFFLFNHVNTAYPILFSPHYFPFCVLLTRVNDSRPIRLLLTDQVANKKHVFMGSLSITNDLSHVVRHVTKQKGFVCLLSVSPAPLLPLIPPFCQLFSARASVTQLCESSSQTLKYVTVFTRSVLTETAQRFRTRNRPRRSNGRDFGHFPM